MFQDINTELEKNLMNLAEDYNKIEEKIAVSNIEK